MRTIKGVAVFLGIVALALCGFFIFGYSIKDGGSIDLITGVLSAVILIQVAILGGLFSFVSNSFLLKTGELNAAIEKWNRRYDKDVIYIKALKNVATRAAGITNDNVDEEYEKLLKKN